MKGFACRGGRALASAGRGLGRPQFGVRDPSPQPTSQARSATIHEAWDGSSDALYSRPLVVVEEVTSFDMLGTQGTYSGSASDIPRNGECVVVHSSAMYSHDPGEGAMASMQEVEPGVAVSVVNQGGPASGPYAPSRMLLRRFSARGRGGRGSPRGGGRGRGRGRGRNFTPREDKPGDWTCTCSKKNWAGKLSCVQCGTAKTTAIPPAQSRITFSGNWICDGCQTSNIKWLTECFSCKMGRPAQHM